MFALGVTQRGQLRKAIYLMKVSHSVLTIYMVKLDLTGKKRNDDGLDVDLINTTPFFHNVGRGLVGKCGGQISPGSTGRVKDLTRGPRAQ
jgi:hypothetical protein